MLETLKIIPISGMVEILIEMIGRFIYPLNKGRTIKGLVVCWMLLQLILRRALWVFGQKIRHCLPLVIILGNIQELIMKIKRVLG